MFDEVWSETFVNLDDIQDLSYDPWDSIDESLDNNGDEDE